MEEDHSEIVTLDVGGTLFKTTHTTLCQYPDTSVLAAMFDQESRRPPPALWDSNGHYFIDRDPKAFAAILSYLRTGELFESYDGVTMDKVLCEAVHFGLQGMADKIRGPKPKIQEIILVLFLTAEFPRRFRTYSFMLAVDQEYRIYQYFPKGP